MATRVLRGGDKLQRALEQLAQKVDRGGTLRVGFLEGATYPDGTPVASVAQYNEFGTPRIPPRPFMRNTISEHSHEWGPALGKALQASDYDTNAALSLVGEGISRQVQDSIRDMRGPQNAPSTIAKKGFDKPLIDTGHMLNSVGYEVSDDD